MGTTTRFGDVVRGFAVCTVLVLLVAWPTCEAHANCPASHPVTCTGWCCEAGWTCGGVADCCVPPSHGDECPAGSCSYCPAQTPTCVGWTGTNHECCTRDAVTCNGGGDVWCCSPGQLCGATKGICTTPLVP